VTIARKVAGSETEWHTVAPRRNYAEHDLPATLITAAQIEALNKNMMINGHVTYIEARFPGNVTALAK
jgi:hypothetical protein